MKEKHGTAKWQPFIVIEILKSLINPDQPSRWHRKEIADPRHGY